MATCTPEDLLKVKASHTGVMLLAVLARESWTGSRAAFGHNRPLGMRSEFPLLARLG